MRSRGFTIPRRWPRIFFCLIWYQVLSGLLVGQRYTAFLRPEFGWLIAFGAVAFVVLGIVSLGDRKGRVGIAGLVRLGVLLLPLAFLVQARGTSLGHQAFVKRYLGPHALVASNGPCRRVTRTRALENLSIDPVGPPAAEAGMTPPLAGPGVAGADAGQSAVAPVSPVIPPGRGQSKAVTILDLHWGPRLYWGLQVQVDGRLYRDAGLASFGSNVVLVYRFVITCCAADALPVTVLVDCGDTPEQADGDWVTVEGIFSKREHDGQEILFIENATATAIPEPERPYLY